MSSYAWLSRFREGSWLSYRKFMLELRQDVQARFSVIDAERERIGEIRVLYKTGPEGIPTEERQGFVVEPVDSSLGKLVQAYCALGGNPFDISMFLTPERPIDFNSEEFYTNPGQGVAYLKNTTYSLNSGVQDGDMNLLKYQSSRVGGKITIPTEANTSIIIQQSRKWITQELMVKVRLEEQILKLCDLREQLDNEVEQMLWATYGSFNADNEFDPQRYNPRYTCGGIAYTIDSTFRVPESDNTVNYDNDVEPNQPGGINEVALGQYPNLISDKEEEKNTAL